MKSYSPSVTGRMDHGSPEIQNIPIKSQWQATANQLRQMARKTTSPLITAVQWGIKVGDLVSWAPVSKPGVWKVVEIPEPRTLIDADYAAIEIKTAYSLGITNPCAEVQLGRHERSMLRPPADEVVLEWIGGACGPTSNIGTHVHAPLADVRKITEMEAIALAASGL